MNHRPPRVGDVVLYAPDCPGDTCRHDPPPDQAAIVGGINADGTVRLAVFYPGGVVTMHDVAHGGPGQLRTWYRRDEIAEETP